jgi:hypothetical protein
MTAAVVVAVIGAVAVAVTISALEVVLDICIHH